MAKIDFNRARQKAALAPQKAVKAAAAKFNKRTPKAKSKYKYTQGDIAQIKEFYNR